MFFKSKKEQYTSSDNFTPPVGLYEIITKLSQPTTKINKEPKINKNQQTDLDQLYSVEKKIDLNSPLHSYASGIQRVRQNKIYYGLKKQIHHQTKEFEEQFDNHIKSPLKKGKLYKHNKYSHNLNQSQNETISLYLGIEGTVNRKSQSIQYLKHPPKVQSVDSLELFLLRDKLQKVTDIPGPGSYDIPSAFKNTEMRIQPFRRQQGREILLQQQYPTVGQYNVQENCVPKSILRFDRYSKRASLFENNKNVPTYYDSNLTSSNLIQNQSKMNLEFPVVFGSTSKR